MEVDSHIGAASSGLIGGRRMLFDSFICHIECLLLTYCILYVDARTLIDHARLEAQNHRFTFDEVSLTRRPKTVILLYSIVSLINSFLVIHRL